MRVGAGVAGGAGLALGGAWASALSGVGAIGGELRFGNGHEFLLSIQK
jgi:hypothetical protein